MNRRYALATLAVLVFAPALQAAHAGGKPIPMQEVIDSPFPWPGDATATLEQAQRAVTTGLTSKGWTATQAGPGKMHGVIHRDDWRCEIDVTFDVHRYSIRYSSSEHLDYNADTKVIHRNFNRWVTLLQQQIDLAARNRS